MSEEQIYIATVRSGRGKSVGIMSTPEAIEVNKKLTGLSVIPGTLNITLPRPLDKELLDFFSFASIGIHIDIKSMGLDYEGEQGFHYGRVTVAGHYPAAIIVFNWNPKPTYAELISPHRLRDALGLEDGDTFEFSLATDFPT